MNIGFYVHYTSLQAGGIFTYSIRVVKLLLNLDQINKIVLIITAEQKEYFKFFDENKKLEFSIINRNKFFTNFRLAIWYLFYILIIIFQAILPVKQVFNQLKYWLSKINPYTKIITSEGIDLLHVPVKYSPLYKTDVPVIITMHDLQEYHFPQYFSLKERLLRFINNKICIKDSDHIIVSFEHVKKDIIKYFNIDSGKVSVCPPPLADNWFLKKEESDWNAIQKKFNLKKEFLLYPAATWEHKNHITLIKSLNILLSGGLKIDLVCTGNKTKHFSNISKMIDELKLSDIVHFLGIVPEEDLIGLYKNTSLVVIPTLYEAGSGPLYEAMRFEVPVICSDVTSLPVTIGNADFLFDPLDVNALSSKIRQGLTDAEFRRSNIENSRKRMEEFQKVDYSKNFLEVYNKLKQQK